MKYEKISNLTVFAAGEGGYNTFRIPAMIILPVGRVLAIAEGRRNSAGDSGDIDLVIKLSDDAGKSFGPMKVIATGEGNVAGNPCPVYDRDTGKVLLMFNRNLAEGYEGMIMQGKAPRTVHLMESSDGGENWSEEKDITVQTKMPIWTWHALGPCHGLQLKSGRLVFPCNHAVLNKATESSGPVRAHTIYSDDHGKTWRIGRDIADFTNECTVTELKDGRVLMNMRIHPGQICRTQAVSKDGGDSFDEYRMIEALSGPECEGAMITVERGEEEYVLVTNPSHPTKRELLIIHESADGGETWKDGCVVTDGHAAYSDITQMDQDHIAVFYETGAENPYERLEFAVYEIK